ncbi:MAG: ATP-binding cassette domain-containing protein [Planctomycetota bacterium]|nr:ATP-binding cassette domain-containing protein [Planctomycetota bacterium]
MEVRNLTKYYGDFLAVDNISFEVWDGEILGFLGPNGAGKSTTIKILACFQPATDGSVTVAGHDVFTDSLNVRKKIGYMPENVPLYPEMRVREYLKFRSAIKGVPRNKRASRMAECLELCGINEVEGKLIGQLSKGYRQRVGLADALIADPKILILDEPLASLDPNQQGYAKRLIQDLKGKHTIIFSTHILSDVEEVCDRMVIIDKGKMVAAGTPEELANRYEDQHHLHVEVVGPFDDIKEKVQGIEGVETVNATEQDGCIGLDIVTGTDTDIREKLSKQFLDNNWGLRELRTQRMDLAEIFRKLTQ